MYVMDNWPCLPTYDCAMRRCDGAEAVRARISGRNVWLTLASSPQIPYQPHKSQRPGPKGVEIHKEKPHTL